MAKRIIIFDDDTDILSICSYILEEQGWEVHTRTHCNFVIETLEEVRPNVILMDNWIPDTGGIIATQLIKEHAEFKYIPVIYFSANNDIKTLAAKAGAETFLAKPFDINELEEVVKKVTAQPAD
ncbi:MAG TPA: response regulator [Sphingobacteriaceae bacterium]|nr:response regulator [Sphingobacteriaceae bacterium]